jgi:hypothetical protein
MNQPRVYKNSPATLIVIVVLFLVLIGGIVFGVGFDSAVFVFPVALFALIVFGSVFIALSSKVTISEEEITAQNILGAKTLRWTEISRVSGKGYSIKLHNYDEDVTVVPNPGLRGYEEIIEFIGRKRPDLFSPQNYGEMKRGLGPFVLMMFVTLLFVGVALALFFTIIDSPEISFASLMPLLIFVIVVLFFGAMMFSIPRSLTLEGHLLILKYLLSEKTLRADEISFIQLAYTQTRNGKQYYISLQLPNRKSIRLSGLSISLPVAYLVLKNWHKNHTQGQSARSSYNDIAPNWSDKSQN